MFQGISRSYDVYSGVRFFRNHANNVHFLIALLIQKKDCRKAVFFRVKRYAHSHVWKKLLRNRARL